MADKNDASNLALIYSTLAVMGKNKEKKKGKELPVSQTPPDVERFNAKVESTTTNCPSLNSTASINPQAERFDAIVAQYTCSSADISNTEDEPENSSDTVLLRNEFAMELKLLVDSEVLCFRKLGA